MVVFAFLISIEAFALTTAIITDDDQVALKTIGIMVSLFVGGALVLMALIELFPPNLESQIEAELTQGLKSKD